MTEKNYGGASEFRVKSAHVNQIMPESVANISSSRQKIEDDDSMNILSDEVIEKYKKAGLIASDTKKYAREFIKKGVLLVEIAEKIEVKIIELGAKPAFPTNLSINENAAHCTPLFNDLTIAEGLLKVDLGAHIDGYVADTSFSLDLENSEENKKLIESSENALKEVCNIAKFGIAIRKIGAVIENSIKNKGFQPIQNLSGHSISHYELHAGITLPNIDNFQEKTIQEGVYAIEPFSTNGLGSVKDGKPSGIYALKKQGNVRDAFARQVLEYIKEEYKTLPFCTRWLYKKFGSRALIAMQRIEEAGLVHQYSQLIESGKGKVAQAEHTLIITEKEKIITTL